MIKVDRLCVQIQNKQILQDISFQIPEGKVIMLLGENGSGKTTLIRSLLQQISYTGSMTNNDKDLKLLTSKELAEVCSYVPQIKEVVEELTVEECMVSGFARFISMFAVPNKNHYEQVDNILESWNLSHIKGKYLQEISGGELQMTYVGRAFLQDAFVMVMDEPCTYLDYRRQNQFLQRVVKLKEKGKSMLISMHDPNLALRYADEILLLHQGKLYAHIQGSRLDMAKQCCECYQTLFQDTFTIIEDGTSIQLVWKE